MLEIEEDGLARLTLMCAKCAHSAAQRQSNLDGAKHMKRGIHRPELCAGGSDEVAEAICSLRRIEEALKVGAVALASATGAPLPPVGADCRPAIYERHKWDRVRAPIPFGHVAIALGQPRDYPALADLASIEAARRGLQDALNEAAVTAQRATGMKANE
jgi:hypothetical protein